METPQNEHTHSTPNYLVYNGFYTKIKKMINETLGNTWMCLNRRLIEYV